MSLIQCRRRPAISRTRAACAATPAHFRDCRLVLRVILPIMFRIIALLFSIGAIASAASLERRLYVTDRSGISVYDIDHGHKLLRKIELPGTGDYKGIAASRQLGKLYVTSYKGDEMVCIDLKDDSIVWKKKYGKYADSMAMTPDGQTMYLPFRDEDSWWVINAADGAVKDKILIGKGKNYPVDPIASAGPHNTWINTAGTRVYMEVLTLPWIFHRGYVHQ